MAIFLGEQKVKIMVDGKSCDIKIITAPLSFEPLLTSDKIILKDLNDLPLMVARGGY